MAGALLEVKYFNTFLLKKTVTNSGFKPVWNGSFGIPRSIGGYYAVTNTGDNDDWAIEESRIRGGYNNTNVDYGAKAYIVEDEPQSTNRVNSLIYSGVFNSRTGINRTNVFSVAEDITKSADPANGSIQKLYAEETNLTILQELKCSKALIDKDAIYSAEGGGTVTTSNLVIGTIQPYAGEYGISQNPESFAVYGYRKYFSDVNNNAMLRLSKDGITEISSYGMKDFFRDKLSETRASSESSQVLGAYDIYSSEYLVSIQRNSDLYQNAYNTLNFDERAQGWVSFFSYAPDQAFSLRNNFYSVKTIKGSAAAPVTTGTTIAVSGVQGFIEEHSIVSGNGVVAGTKVVSFTGGTTVVVDTAVNITAITALSFSGVAKIWKHYATASEFPLAKRGNFYNVNYKSSITFVFNPNPTNSKSFKTIAYEGSNGWELSSFISDETGKTLNAPNNSWSNAVDSTSQIKSYGEGEYALTQATGVTLAASLSTNVSLNTATFSGIASVGSVIDGSGVNPGTRVVSYNTTTGLLTTSQNMNVSLGTTLVFSGAVNRSQYSVVFGTSNPAVDRYRAGFLRKENKYVANLLNDSTPGSGEVIFGNLISGVKGFYSTVKLSTDGSTDLGGEKTLFSAESVYTMNNGY
tara:strand:+ start:5502 stop:7403 length:1902 start_codon:yes stop_codon:yes gene_type:complete